MEMEWSLVLLARHALPELQINRSYNLACLLSRLEIDSFIATRMQFGYSGTAMLVLFSEILICGLGLWRSGAVEKLHIVASIVLKLAPRALDGTGSKCRVTVPGFHRWAVHVWSWALLGRALAPQDVQLRAGTWNSFILKRKIIFRILILDSNFGFLWEVVQFDMFFYTLEN